jgi:hypothetical protein
VTDRAEIRDTARRFVAGAFEALAEEHVIPMPIYHPYVAVGRDYYGDTIRGVEAHYELERLLDAAYPERFADPRTRLDAEFASHYIFSFLEACVARCGRADDFDPAGPAVDESIDELLAVLDASTDEIVCCRHVAHLTTTAGDEVTVGDVTIVPEGEIGRGERAGRIAREIAGAARAWNRDDPRPYGPPHSLLIVREISGGEPYSVAERLGQRLDRFLLLARLLTAGTVQSTYEISGATTLVARMNPLMREFRFRQFGGLVRRTVRLSGAEGPAFAALGSLVDEAEIKRKGMIAASFDIALSRYNRAVGDEPYEQLVDLATALEAALIGERRSTGAVTLRLRNRAAALLATDGDRAEALFEDIGRLYNLRSTIVHGGQFFESDLRKAIGAVSTVSPRNLEHRFGVAVGQAVDRMRDIVRRAILARLCLGAQPEPPWPFAGGGKVDAALSDDATRAAWRARWRDRLEELGVGGAADPAPPAVDALVREDR